MPNSNPQLTDPRERRRQRERERYAQMPQHKKDELLKKQHEARQRKEVVETHVSQDCEMVATCNKESIDLDENTDWLHRNDLYQRQTTHIASDDQQSHNGSIQANSTVELIDLVGVNGTNVSEQTISSPNTQFVDPKERKRQRNREYYSNMTSKQRQAKKDRENTRCALLRSTTSSRSIAMENPMYNSIDVVLPFRASLPLGSTVNVDFTIPSQTQELALDDGMEIHASNGSTRKRRKSVSAGQRNAHIGLRNASFASRIDTKCKKVSLPEFGDLCPDLEGAKVAEPQAQSTITTYENIASTTQDINATVPQTESLAIDECGDELIFEDHNEEDYIFAGQYEENDDEVEIEQADDASAISSGTPDPYDRVYSNIPESTHMLEDVPNCRHCSAKRFHKEPPGFCCRDGKISLSNPDTPLELMRLWTSTDSDARHFRDSIRFFNGHFSFTSLYCQLDSATTDIRKSGVYMFRAHGQMYHNIGSFASHHSDPQHLEMYFYDDDPNLEH